MVKLQFAKTSKGAVIPSKREGDAGYDLYIDRDWFNMNKGVIMLLPQGDTFVFPIGLKSVIPNEYYAQIQERGSTGIHAMKYGAGVIDASFRGEWKIIITNCNSSKPIFIYDDSIVRDKKEVIREYFATKMCSSLENIVLDDYVFYPISKGIAQFVLLPVPKVEIEEVTEEEIELNTTERGAGMLGSSGK